jgi:hypothetical protein
LDATDEIKSENSELLGAYIIQVQIRFDPTDGDVDGHRNCGHSKVEKHILCIEWSPFEHQQMYINKCFPSRWRFPNTTKALNLSNHVPMWRFPNTTKALNLSNHVRMWRFPNTTKALNLSNHVPMWRFPNTTKALNLSNHVPMWRFPNSSPVEMVDQNQCHFASLNFKHAYKVLNMKTVSN